MSGHSGTSENDARGGEDLTVTIVDDDPSVLKALSRLLQSAELKTAAFNSPVEFLEAYDPERTGCLVLDLTMPGLNGLQIQRLLRDRGGSPPIVFLTGTGDVPEAVHAMRQGAVEFLTKPIDAAILLPAVRAALEQARSNRRERMETLEIQRRLQTLTPREREVLSHVVSGRLNKQIAADLNIALGTIKLHRARVMEKMRVESVAELVRLVQRAEITGTTTTDELPAEGAEDQCPMV